MTKTKRDWLIVKVANRDTLLLPNRLGWRGIEAYAPAETIQERKGESRTRRNKRIPLAPGFVFVAAIHTHEMIEMHEAPPNPLYAFNFLRTVGELSYCPDAALKPLRLAEMKGRAPEEVRKWKVGEPVQYPANGFEGLTGIVRRVRGKSVWIGFPGMPWDVEAPAILLLDDTGEGRREAA